MNQLYFTDEPRRRHRVAPQPGAHQVSVDGSPVAIRPDGDGHYVALVDGRWQRIDAVVHGDTVHLQMNGRAWRIARVDPTRHGAGGSEAGAGASHAPMPGVVVSLLAAVGQRVDEGAPLLVIESMKLQTTLAAACAGVVAELPVAAGQSFQRGAVLARVTPGETSE